MSGISNSSERLVNLGDFNFPDINEDTLSGSSPVFGQLFDLIFKTGLSQLIGEPTHNHDNVLDLLSTKILNKICILSLEVQSNPFLSSDHYDITFTDVTIHKLLPNLQCIILLLFHKVVSMVSAIIYFTLTLKLVFWSTVLSTILPQPIAKIKFKYLKPITKSNHIPSTINLACCTANTDYKKANLFQLLFMFSLSQYI